MRETEPPTPLVLRAGWLGPVQPILDDRLLPEFLRPVLKQPSLLADRPACLAADLVSAFYSAAHIHRHILRQVPKQPSLLAECPASLPADLIPASYKAHIHPNLKAFLFHVPAAHGQVSLSIFEELFSTQGLAVSLSFREVIH